MSDNPTGKDYVGSDALYADVRRCMKLVAEMNTGYHTEAEVREYLRQITCSEIDETVRVFPPFNINYGRKTTFGKDSFVNFGCTFLALGGITIGEGAFIASHCVLATEYHPEDPEKTPFAAHQTHSHRAQRMDRSQCHHTRRRDHWGERHRRGGSRGEQRCSGKHHRGRSAGKSNQTN